MNISDLIGELSKRNFTPREAEIIVKATYDIVGRSLSAGADFSIRGFGRFSTRPHPPLPHRKPKPGAIASSVPTTRIPHFQPCKKLKRFINQSPLDRSSQ